MITRNHPSAGTVQFQDGTSEQEMAAAMKTLDAKPGNQTAPSRFVPELTSGNDPQANARNLQGEMGWTDPVNPSASMDIGGRIALRAAPTEEERSSYLNTEYGQGNWVQAAGNRFFVKQNDGKGGKEWVINDPKGLDVGDFAEFAGRVPEVVAGFIAASSMVPGPGSAISKAIKVSGAGSLATNLVGAISDAAFRLSSDKPVDPIEIAKRRALGSGLETVVGAALPFGVRAIVGTRTSREATKSTYKAFMNAGNEAKAVLKNLGYNPVRASEIAPEMLERNASNLSTEGAGNVIGKVLTQFDEWANKKATQYLGKSASNVEVRAESILASGTTSRQLTAPDAGKATLGAVKQHFVSALETSKKMYSAANAEIESATGGNKNIIDLTNTSKVVKQMLSNPLVDSDGKVIPLAEPLRRELLKLQEASGAKQGLDAIRNVRTMLGEQAGRGGIFEGMDTATAKRLYGSLSEDIDNSIASYTGSGAKMLKQANAYYRNMIQPVEANSMLSKAVNGGYDNPEQIIEDFASAGTNDWAAIKTVMPKNTYSQFRRAVADTLIGGEQVMVAGKPYANIASLGKNISAIKDDVIKDEIFGNRNVWQGLQRLGHEQEFIVAKQGVFSNAGRVAPDALRQASDIMRAQGFDASNRFLNKVLAAQEARATSLGASLASQVKNGSTEQAAKNPVALLDHLMSGNYNRDLAGVMAKLDPATRRDVSRAAFARVFEKAMDTAKSVTGNPKLASYDVSVVKNMVLGNPEQRKALSAILGNEKYALARSWADYATALNMEYARGGKIAHGAARILSVLPYGKLLAARIGTEAIETASGKRVMAGIDPLTAVNFAETRLFSDHKIKTVLTNTVIQNTMSHPLYRDYTDMMGQYTPEQRDAIDAFMLGGQSR